MMTGENTFIDAMLHYGIRKGRRITPSLLETIMRTHGAPVAFVIDSSSYACPVCGHNTYGGGICSECAGRLQHAFGRVRDDYLELIDDLTGEIIAGWWLGDVEAATKPVYLVADLRRIGVRIDGLPDWISDAVEEYLSEIEA